MLTSVLSIAAVFAGICTIAFVANSSNDSDEAALAIIATGR